MRYRQIFILLILCVSWSCLHAFEGDKVALTRQVKGDVKIKHSGERRFKSDLLIGQVIYNGDQVKTGSNGFVAIVFLDDKSEIKIRENSDLVIFGDRTERGIDKRLSITVGTLKARVEPILKSGFIVTTASSTASVKGTEFWVICHLKEGDIFMGISGLIEIRNRKSGQVIQVGEYQKGYSTLDGQLSKKEFSPKELPVDEEATVTIRHLELQMQDNQGTTKTLQLEFDH
jgi:hypothetical protein